ncbi:hypothetical protein [Methylobacterium sp. WCS2018Hpa-22]|uniref:hypothetical protein n=1 Tax=Methylobacterium sp. WCS2018Hpa-22 TaxID=3073633 RepID=UPI00288B3205|nr:hypothetical protein [Methylobacterium sp. WCS2018Hpa-22]
MSFEPDHKALAISGADVASERPPADADSIIAALERAAVAASASPPSRKMVGMAKRLLVELRASCRGRADAKPMILRGRAALKEVEAAYRPNEADVTKDTVSAERRAAKAETASRRVAEGEEVFAQNAERMRKIVGALIAASKTEDPSRFTVQATLCQQIWDEIGPAGVEGPALTKAYRKATAAFWARAGVPDPGKAEE